MRFDLFSRSVLLAMTVSGLAAFDPAAAADPAVPLEQLLYSLGGRYLGAFYVFAHSMGNVVVGEALRLGAQAGDGQLVNTYVPTQAAVPVHCYDPAQPFPNGFFKTSRSVPLNYVPGGPSISIDVSGPETPNIYPNWLTRQAVTTRINFFNENDYALSRPFWETDQALKPDQYFGPKHPYWFCGDITVVPPVNGFQAHASIDPCGGAPLDLGDASNVRDRYEIMAYASEPGCRALGATANVGNGFGSSTDLRGVWGTDPTGQNFSYHRWHSAQFRFTNADQQNYWKTLLGPTGFNLQ